MIKYKLCIPILVAKKFLEVDNMQKREEKRKKVSKDLRIDNILYKSSNLLLLETRRNEVDSDNVYIICEGVSMSVDNDNILCKWDPFMTIPTSAEYPNLRGNIINMYFPFECKGLEYAGEELAVYINFNIPHYKTVWLIGHSKGGVCFANMAKWISRRVRMDFISAPFGGTTMVDAELMKKRFATSFEYRVYQKLYKRHKVDLDLMPDSKFLANCDFSGVGRHICRNVISETRNVYEPVDRVCKYLNFRCLHARGDGIVTVSSQKKVNRLCKEVIYLDASHANSLGRFLSKGWEKYIID